MGIINQMIANDAKKAIAKNMLREGASVSFVIKTTELDETTVLDLQAELNAA